MSRILIIGGADRPLNRLLEHLFQVVEMKQMVRPLDELLDVSPIMPDPFLEPEEGSRAAGSALRHGQQPAMAHLRPGCRSGGNNHSDSHRQNPDLSRLQKARPPRNRCFKNKVFRQPNP